MGKEKLIGLFYKPELDAMANEVCVVLSSCSMGMAVVQRTC